MSRSPRVTVAGAGVLGLASALALADAGAAVTVADPGGPNASYVAAGMLAPAFEALLDDTARPHLDLLMTARDLWPGFAARTGVALDRSGALAVGRESWVDALGARAGALDLRFTEVGAATAQALAPGLAPSPAALLTREDWRVDAAASLAALRSAAEAVGVAFETRAVTARGDADWLVIATGADQALAAAAPELGRLAPIKGHIVRMEIPADGVVVRGEGVYVAPGPEMIFGATMEAGRSGTDVDAEIVGRLTAAGLALFPGARDAAPRGAAAVRAATPDGLPMVGPSADDRVLLAVGARRNGWLLAPLVGQMIASFVTGADVALLAPRLAPARFG